MAHNSSFTIDTRGNVSRWDDEAGRYPELSSRDVVGAPAGLVIERLLGSHDGDSGGHAPAALFLTACRGEAGTVIASRGTAPSLHAADVESAFEFSAFEHSTAGLEVYDADLSVLRANSAALAMRGRSAEQVLQRHVGNLDSRLPLAPLLQRVIVGDEAAVQERINGRDGRGDPRVFAVTAFQLRDDQQTIGAGAVIHDVTDQNRSEAAARLLAEAHEEIGSTLDAMRTAQELAVVAVRDFADAVSVDLVDDVIQGAEAPAPPVGTDVVLRRAAFEAPGGLQAVYRVGEMSYFTFPTPYAQVIADLTPILLDPKTSPSDWLMHDAARAGALGNAGIHSMIIVPLSFHGRVLGLASFYRGPRHPVSFDASDVGLAQQVSAKACVHIENARRYTRERTMAVSLQRNLLPRIFPDVSAVSAAHFYTPGSNETVWFDVIELSGARVGLAIGRVSQQGLNASAAMGRYRTALDTLAVLDLPPHELLAHLDDATGQFLSNPTGLPSSSTDPPCCLYAVYDPVTGEFAVASAGWPAPLLISPAGDITTVEVPVGAPLGQGLGHDLHRQVIAPESMLVLFSQSFLEPGPRAEERMAQLRQAATRSDRAPKAICDSIVRRMLGGLGGESAALLAARTHRLPDDRVAAWTGNRDPAAVGEARDRATQQLEEWGLEAHAFTTEMVVSELVTNVIRHASGNPTVRLIRDRYLTVEVSDNATTAPHLRHARAQDEDGRGLLIIASLARRWGTRYTPDGKTIWVENSLDEVRL
ncbi:SpoIIE family protein phosphatase [Streptomyces sp. NBC_01725]|uniref:ATP-binding SpoIIE family protein phosphatase n=1 Tax=Streptomyces sp. NBC_01725 TaxID=2975923 RepID=UPI002E2C789D|nr:SpoIIE family protein phosphatase [Streptomyces sp. NBC_01725]